MPSSYSTKYFQETFLEKNNNFQWCNWFYKIYQVLGRRHFSQNISQILICTLANIHILTKFYEKFKIIIELLGHSNLNHKFTRMPCCIINHDERLQSSKLRVESETNLNKAYFHMKASVGCIELMLKTLCTKKALGILRNDYQNETPFLHLLLELAKNLCFKSLSQYLPLERKFQAG